MIEYDSLAAGPHPIRQIEPCRRPQLSLLALPLLALLSGCSDTSSSSSSCTVTPHPSGATIKTPEFLYSTNGNSSTSVYAIESDSGALTDIAGSPLYADNYASYLVIAPSRTYAAGPGSGGGTGDYVSAFNIDQGNGELSTMPNQQIASNGGAVLDLSFDPLERYEYLSYPYGAISHSIANGTEVVTLLDHSECQGEPSGNIVYCRTATDVLSAPMMSGFTVDQMTGKWLELAASPFSIPYMGQWAFSSSGKFVYMAGGTGVVAFVVDATKKTWNTLNHIDHDDLSGFARGPVALDPAGRFAYAKNALDYHPRPDGQVKFQISAYPIDQTTGELMGPTCPGAWVAAPTSFVVDPSGLFLYIAGIDGVSAYAIDQSNGGLAEIAGSPFVYAGANGKQISSPGFLAVIGLAHAGVKETAPASPAGIQMAGARQGTALSLSGKVTTTAGWPLCGGCLAVIPGFPGRSSTDGTGLGARFNRPEGITTDGLSLYVADNYGQTIRKVDPYTRKVTTIAGQAGVAGAINGTGSAATFNGPNGITTDGTNLYVADTGNGLIRKVVIATGVVTTLAGGASPPAPPYGDGLGSAATFLTPGSLTTDGTDLYVGDGKLLRRVVIATAEVTTLVGTGRFLGFGAPTTDGTSLYAITHDAESGETLLVKIAPTSGTLAAMTAATAVVSPMYQWTSAAPTSLTCDGTSLYIGLTSVAATMVAKIDLATYAPGQALTTIAGGVGGSANGVGAAAGFLGVTGMTTDGTSLFVADFYNDNIRRIR